MTTNSQLSTNEPKKIKERKTKKTETKQTRTGTESKKWRSHGGFSAGRGRGQNGGKGTGNKQYNCQEQNRQGELKNSTGSGETKELLYV